MSKLDFIRGKVNIALIGMLASTTSLSAQNASNTVQVPQASQMQAAPGQAAPSATGSPAGGDVAAGGANGFAAGYAPSARYKGGMVTGGNTDGYIPATRESVAVQPPAGVNNPMVMNQAQMQAYEEALRQTFTMTPEMIAYYKSLARQQDQAMNAEPDPDIKVGSSYISLEPGEAPAEIILASNYTSTISFYDKTGQAWPVTQYVHGREGAFQVIQLGKESNSMTITPLATNAKSNIVIMLQGEPKPAILRLSTSLAEVDLRRDVIVSKAGPNAVIAPDIVVNPASPIEREAGNRVLSAALDGADMPPSAQPVKISGINAQAWVLGDDLYVRSRAKLSVPAPKNSMNGPDGLRVYQVTKSPVLTFYQDGVATMASVDLP